MSNAELLIGVEENMIVIKTVGVDSTYPLHKHDYFEFFLVVRGSATHIVNSSMQIVTRGSLVLIRPDDQHCYDYYKSQDFEFYNVGFSTELFEDYNKCYSGLAKELIDCDLPFHIRIDERKLSTFESNLDKLAENSASKNDRKYGLLLTKLVGDVIYALLNAERSTDTMVAPEWLIYVIDEMSKPECFIEGLPRLLSLCNYSQEHINRVFKKYINTTPTKFINELRLKYAFKLLKETETEVVDICENSGFHNLSHFYTEFKKYFGYSPTKVRKNSQIKLNDVE